MTTAFSIRCYVMGNESLLVQCSDVLLERGHRILGVVTSDELIRQWAQDRELRVLRPGRDLAERLGDTPFDWFFSIANLSILPASVLAMPTRGTINFHDGPLPRYAGLHATSWAILHGERTHGVTWHLVEGGVDEGDIVEQRLFELGERETALTLNTRCYELGIESFTTLLEDLERGELNRRAQDLSQRTYFGRFDRPEAASSIDWGQPAHRIVALVRALDYGPYPNPIGVPKVVLDRDALLLPEVERGADSVSEPPGTVIAIDDDGLEVATRTGSLRFPRVLNPDGEQLAPEVAHHLGVRPGAMLRTSTRARLGEVDREMAAHEAFWTRRLRTLQPAHLPQVDPLTRRELERFLPLRTEARVVSTLAIAATADLAALLAAVGVWLARTSGMDELDIGYRHPGIAKSVAGCEVLYADRVPLRLRVDRDEPFEALIARTSRELELLARRGTYPRELVVRRPDVRRPTWDIVVDQLASLEEHVLPSGVAVALVTDSEHAALVYDEDRIDARRAEAMRDQLEVLLRAGAQNPSTTVRTLPLLNELERTRLLETWNETAIDYAKDCGVHQQFEAQVDRTPHATALVYRDRSITYAELDAAANQIAHRLLELGVAPDMPVGLCTERSLDLVAGALGILKAGGAYVPLDPSYPAERLAHMVADSGAGVIVTQRACCSSLPECDAKLVLLDADESLGEQPSTRPLLPGFDGSNLAYLIYTSGSTGEPKGVMVEHRNVANFFAGMDQRIARSPQDDSSGVGPADAVGPSAWLAVTSLSFDISVLELFWTLARGFKVVISSDADRALVSGGGAGVSVYQQRRIDFSLFYFASDEGEQAADKYRLLLDGARFADANDFAAVWTPERHFHAFGGLYPNPSVASAALAVITRNVMLRAGSCVNPLHHPVRIAEEWALVDNLSNGRVGISFAAGWQPNDFVLRPDAFEDNKRKMIDEIDIIRRLWRGEAVTFEGPKGPVQVRTLPRPVQEELPFFITAAGNPQTFELAGALGGGILTHLLGQTLEEVEQKIATYRRAWKHAGHPGEGHVVLMLHTFVGGDSASVKATVREPMKAYLKSSMMLIQQHAWSFPAFKRHAREDRSFKDNFLDLSPEDTEALLEHSFERYFETSGLFGTPDDCAATVEACRRIGVDEIGCLIDYGIASQTVLDHLPYLNELREATSAPRFELDAEDYSIAAQLRRHGVTHMQCTPSMAQMLVMNDEARAALRGLKHLLVGGEAFPGELARRLRKATDATIVNLYGPTETTIWSSTETVEPCEGTVSIGRPIANTRLYVLDEDRQLVPVGVPGELYIGGDGVARGYFRRDALTRERFVPDPFRSDGARMYRTGDRVRWRQDGHLEFLGRMDHQVKLRGYRIELGEIETILRRHDSVQQAVVIAREDNPGDKRLVAYVVMNGDLDAEALRSHLGRHLPEFMIPTHFVRMDRLPLTPNKKVDSKALPRPEARGSRQSGVHAEPVGEIEQKIASVWKEILGLPEVGRRDNFFDLGGHSLLAVQAHREIREATGRELTVTDIFRFPTVAALAEHLGSDGHPSASLQRSADRAAGRRQAVRRRRGTAFPRV